MWFASSFPSRHTFFLQRQNQAANAHLQNQVPAAYHTSLHGEKLPLNLSKEIRCYLNESYDLLRSHQFSCLVEYCCAAPCRCGTVVSQSRRACRFPAWCRAARGRTAAPAAPTPASLRPIQPASWTPAQLCPATVTHCRTLPLPGLRSKPYHGRVKSLEHDGRAVPHLSLCCMMTKMVWGNKWIIWPHSDRILQFYDSGCCHAWDTLSVVSFFCSLHIRLALSHCY